MAPQRTGPTLLLGLAVAATLTAVAAPHSAHDLFKPLLHRSYSLSPDGRYMLEMALTDKDDADRLDRVRSRDDLLKLGQPDQRIMLTDLRSMEYLDLTPSNRNDIWVGRFRWLSDRDFVWSANNRQRGEITLEVRTIGADPAGRMRIEATRNLGRDARILAAVPATPWQLLVVHQGEEGESIYRIDAKRPIYLQLNAANRLGGPFRGVQRWVADRSGALRAVGLERRGDELRVMVPDGAGWRRCATFPLEHLEWTDLVGVDDASGRLLLITNHGSDKSVLRELDPVTGALGKVVIGDARNDVSAEFADPRDGRIIGAVLNDNETRIQFTDPGVVRLQAEASRLLPRANPRVINFSADRRHAVIFTGQSDDPGRYHYLTLDGGKALLIESTAPWLEGKRFARSEPIELKARDGLVVHGQFTRPLPDPARPAAEKPPVVLMPHGGPHGIRDNLSYDPDVQFLASRGYAVLQVDFRGSGGYGREFLTAGFRRWGAEMQNDLLDALDHVAAKGWVDPQRACAYGASYGGYAAVMSVLQQPERFRCAVTYAGVSDLTLLFRSGELRHQPLIQHKVFERLRAAIGDPEKERVELQARSPAYIAKGLTRPLLIAHGDADVRVEPEHAWRLRAAVESGGGQVEWLMAKGEGHGFTKAENIEAFYAMLDRFLATHLAAPSR